MNNKQLAFKLTLSFCVSVLFFEEWVWSISGLGVVLNFCSKRSLFHFPDPPRSFVPHLIWTPNWGSTSKSIPASPFSSLTYLDWQWCLAIGSPPFQCDMGKSHPNSTPSPSLPCLGKRNGLSTLHSPVTVGAVVSSYCPTGGWPYP